MEERDVFINNSNPHRSNVRKVYFAAGAALCFPLVMGMAIGYSASATVDMQRPKSPIHPNDYEVSWIGSVLALGVIAGAVIAVYLSNLLGRKGSLIFTSVPFLLGWLLIAYARNLTYIYIGRFIKGVCIGIICAATPPYLIEISTSEVRGLLGASFQLAVVTGVLIINAIGAVLSWKWLAIPAPVFIVVSTCGLCFVPESPRWLLENGMYQEAASALQYLRGSSHEATSECAAINDDLESQPNRGMIAKDLLKPVFFMPALLSFALFVFQQVCGSNAVLFYTVEIFKSSGNSLDPFTATVIMDAVLVIATAISCVLMDRVGRKSLLIVSGLMMGISLLSLGIHSYVSSRNVIFKIEYGWIPLACLVVYIFSFSIGLGPIPPFMMAEMTPLRYRSLICGTSIAICWTSAFIITKTFHSLEHSIHDYGTYILYATFSLMSCVFTLCYLPETKGRSLQDIEDGFQNYFLRKKLGNKYQEIS